MEYLKEEWKSIKNYEGLYMISNYGRVLSFQNRNIYRKKTIVLKSGIQPAGYLCHILYKNGIHKTFTVHTLVYDHFGVGKRNGREIQVDHQDENKRNNRIDNLQLLTARKNKTKSLRLIKKASKHIGVFRYSKDKKWIASIYAHGQYIYLGLFVNEIDAHNEYQRALKEFENTGKVTSKAKKKPRTNKYRGITRTKYNKWTARITINKKRIFLGNFPDENEAYLAREKFLRKYR